MAEDKQALVQQYRHARDELLEAIDGLTDEQFTEKSLDGWSIKDHLAHPALWDDVRASEVARISTGHASAWRMTEEQDLAYNARASCSTRLSTSGVISIADTRCPLHHGTARVTRRAERASLGVRLVQTNGFARRLESRAVIVGHRRPYSCFTLDASTPIIGEFEAEIAYRTGDYAAATQFLEAGWPPPANWACTGWSP